MVKINPFNDDSPPDIHKAKPVPPPPRSRQGFKRIVERHKEEGTSALRKEMNPNEKSDSEHLSDLEENRQTREREGSRGGSPREKTSERRETNNPSLPGGKERSHSGNRGSLPSGHKESSFSEERMEALARLGAFQKDKLANDDAKKNQAGQDRQVIRTEQHTREVRSEQHVQPKSGSTHQPSTTGHPQPIKKDQSIFDLSNKPTSLQGEIKKPLQGSTPDKPVLPQAKQGSEASLEAAETVHIEQPESESPAANQPQPGKKQEHVAESRPQRRETPAKETGSETSKPVLADQRTAFKEQVKDTLKGREEIPSKSTAAPKTGERAASFREQVKQRAEGSSVGIGKEQVSPKETSKSPDAQQPSERKSFREQIKGTPKEETGSSAPAQGGERKTPFKEQVAQKLEDVLPELAAKRKDTRDSLGTPQVLGEKKSTKEQFTQKLEDALPEVAAKRQGKEIPSSKDEPKSPFKGQIKQKLEEALSEVESNRKPDKGTVGTQIPGSEKRASFREQVKQRLETVRSEGAKSPEKTAGDTAIPGTTTPSSDRKPSFRDQVRNRGDAEPMKAPQTGQKAETVNKGVEGEVGKGKPVEAKAKPVSEEVRIESDHANEVEIGEQSKAASGTTQSKKPAVTSGEAAATAKGSVETKEFRAQKPEAVQATENKIVPDQASEQPKGFSTKSGETASKPSKDTAQGDIAEIGESTTEKVEKSKTVENKPVDNIEEAEKEAAAATTAQQSSFGATQAEIKVEAPVAKESIEKIIAEIAKLIQITKNRGETTATITLKNPPELEGATITINFDSAAAKQVNIQFEGVKTQEGQKLLQDNINGLREQLKSAEITAQQITISDQPKAATSSVFQERETTPNQRNEERGGQGEGGERGGEGRGREGQAEEQ